MKYRAAITPCAEYDDRAVYESLTEAIDAIGGLDWVIPGMRVAIKANLADSAPPERAVCTHPSAVYALCRILVERGALPVVGDSPGGLFNSAFIKRLYSVTGYDRIRDIASLNEDFTQREAVFPDGKTVTKFAHTAWLDNCDAVITFAKLKTHGMMGMTGAVKNQYGIIPGTVKLEYHYRHPDHKEFSDMLVDLCEYTAPKLSLIDAVTAMDGNGPTAGRPRSCGAFIAALSPHEADVIGAHLLGISPLDVPTIARAAERNLVIPDISKLDIYGDPDSFVIPDCELVPQNDITAVRGAKGITLGFFRLITARRPMPDKALCVGCGKCADLCPAKAITMKHKRPSIDRKKCIRCFCCQEFCPVGAMKVHRTAIAKLLNRIG